MLQRVMPGPWCWMFLNVHGPCWLFIIPSICRDIITETQVLHNYFLSGSDSSVVIRSDDPPAYQQLCKKYGDNIPSLLYYNKGL